MLARRDLIVHVLDAEGRREEQMVALGGAISRMKMAASEYTAVLGSGSAHGGNLYKLGGSEIGGVGAVGGAEVDEEQQHDDHAAHRAADGRARAAAAARILVGGGGRRLGRRRR